MLFLLQPSDKSKSRSHFSLGQLLCVGSEKEVSFTDDKCGLWCLKQSTLSGTFISTVLRFYGAVALLMQMFSAQMWIFKKELIIQCGSSLWRNIICETLDGGTKKTIESLFKLTLRKDTES